MKKYLSEKNLIRLMVVIIVLLALLAGYYQANYSLEKKKYLRLEEKYARVGEQIDALEI